MNSGQMHSPRLKSIVVLSIKMLFGSRVRFYSLVLNLAVAFILLQNLTAIFSGVILSFTNLPAASGAPIWIRSRFTPMYDNPSPLPNNALAAVRAVEGLAWAEPYYHVYTFIKLPEGTTTEVSLIAVSDTTLAGLPANFIAGSPEDLNDLHAIAIDLNEPDVLGNPGIGANFEINDCQVEVRALVDMKPNSMGDPVVFMTETNYLRMVPHSRKALSFIIAAPAAGVPPEELCRRINECAPELVAMPQADFMKETAFWYIDNSFFPQIFLLTACIGMILALVITAQQLYTFVLSDLTELATFKALGYSNGTLRSILVLQALTGGVFACGFGSIVLAVEQQIFSRIPGMMFYQPIVLYLGGCAALLLVCVLSCAAPLAKITHIQPADVFRR